MIELLTLLVPLRKLQAFLAPQPLDQLLRDVVELAAEVAPAVGKRDRAARACGIGKPIIASISVNSQHAIEPDDFG